jgi:hypothetical protein
MTEQRARELVALNGCELLPATSKTSLIIVNKKVNFKYQCWISDLQVISERDFIAVLRTGHTPHGTPSLPGYYTDYKRTF